jgi:hypothetical protein
MEKKFNFVYITINKINGKCYIGSHGTDDKNDKYLGSGNLIECAIYKYGANKFVKVKLKDFDTILEARLNETYYINLFDTLSPNGYNISPTGGMEKGTFGKHSEESKEKIRIKKTGKNLSKTHREHIILGLLGNTYRKGCTLTKEHKDKISKSLEGIKRSKETKEKYRKSKLGIKHKVRKCPYCNKEISINNYKRYHGDNCKFKISLINKN